MIERLIMYPLIIGLFVLLTIVPIKTIKPEFKELYTEFNSLVDKNCNNRSNLFYPPKSYITFKKNLWSTRNPVIGQCTRWFFSWQIEVDPVIWEIYDAKERKLLLFHELTHCILRVDHTPESTNYMATNLNSYIEEQDLYKQLIHNINEVCK